MHRVATSKEVSCNSRVLHAYQADYTVLLQSLIDTLMIIFEKLVETASTIIAMEVCAFSNATNSTPITMVDSLLLVLIIIQTADLAVIL